MISFCYAKSVLPISLELSDQGKQLAGTDPYLIHNGNSRELVITQPDHIKDFYRNDTKGQVSKVLLIIIMTED